MSYFEQMNPLLQALLAGIFTWSITAMGAALVYCFKEANQKVLDSMVGFGAGVMIAASFWSLLMPAIELSTQLGQSPWLIPAIGFLSGGLFIVIASILMDRYQPSFTHKVTAGSKEKIKRSFLLVIAVTLHNIPEGFAVGVAFGGAGLGIAGMTLISAISLSMGIGFQNFPEGAAVSLPLYREGFSKRRSFHCGQFSAIVEPIASLLGAYAVLSIQNILPYCLSFASGAMIGVVAAELIPESCKSSKNLATFGVIVGFITMMILDVALS